MHRTRVLIIGSRCETAALNLMPNEPRQEFQTERLTLGDSEFCGMRDECGLSGNLPVISLNKWNVIYLYIQSDASFMKPDSVVLDLRAHYCAQLLGTM